MTNSRKTCSGSDFDIRHSSFVIRHSSFSRPVQKEIEVVRRPFGHLSQIYFRLRRLFGGGLSCAGGEHGQNHRASPKTWRFHRLPILGIALRIVKRPIDPAGEKPYNRNRSQNFAWGNTNQLRDGPLRMGFGPPLVFQRPFASGSVLIRTRFRMHRLRPRAWPRFVFGNRAHTHGCFSSRRSFVICASGSTCSMGWWLSLRARRAGAGKS